LIQKVFVDLSMSFLQTKHLNIGGIMYYEILINFNSKLSGISQ